MPTVQSHPAGVPSWFDLGTTDAEKARAFYGALFGWTFDIGGPEFGGYAMCKVGGRNAAGIGQLPPGAPFPPAWTVYFNVESADATLAAIKEHGGAVLMGPMDVATEGRLAVCADPTGAVFGLWQPLNHKGAEVTAEPGAMAWQEVNTRDAAKARPFYEKVFGLASEKMEGMDYWLLKRGDVDAGGVSQMGAQFPAEVPSHWMPYFAVADADAAVAKVQELGGQVRAPAFDTPYGRMAFVADQTGANFAVVKLPPRP